MSKKSLGLLIQKLREEKGFKSSRKLAIRLKELDPKNAISHVSMAHIENGRFNTSREILTLIANALDYSVDGLLAESEQVVDDVAEIIKDKPDNFVILSGDDGLTLPMIYMGAEGVISVIGQSHPKE